MAVETRTSDAEIHDLLAAINHRETHITVTAEREFIAAIGGGCRVPVAAFATIDGEELRMAAMAGLPDGSELFRVEIVGDVSDSKSAGQSAAHSLMESGASNILYRAPA